jgi:Big-like domain-containing protein/calcineurin-like phosphoesterase family protein/purple acid phosphatase-like protein
LTRTPSPLSPIARPVSRFLTVAFVITLAIVWPRPGATAVGDIVYYVWKAPVRVGSWRVVAEATAAGGSRLEQPNVNAARITTPLASPTHYVDFPVTVQANTPYHLWLRGKAYQNFGDNDSVWVQTSGTVDGNGVPIYRIGTSSATMVNLEDCSGCTISNWAWQDNGYGSGVSGPLLRFATSGTQTIRIQAREDGISLDQFVLSSNSYLTTAPGARTNDATILPESTGSGTGGTTITLVRGPYLQQVGASRAIVVWATRQPGSASVEYRVGAGSLAVAQATSTYRASSATGIPEYYQHEAVLTGLTASTSYQYDLRVAGVDPTPGVVDSFRTAPAAGTGTIRFAAFGDSGTGSSAQAAIAGRLDAETFDFALHTGDVAYSYGTYAQFESFFFPYYDAWLRRKAIFPSIGNHDDRTGSATPYRTLFVLPRDGASLTYPNNGERFYSFDYGPVHFICLDTEAAFQTLARRQEQIAWLTEDLQASQDRPWRVVYFHRPPYNSGSEHGSDLTVRQVFGPLFEQYNVQLVLNGHEHSYERSVPWRESTNTARQAVTYVVTGGGGAGLYPSGRSAWTALSRSVNHYVRATMTASDLTLEAVDSSGAVIDRFTLNRAAQENDAAAPTVAISAPATGAILSGTETIEVSADDDTRVEKVDLWVDGQLRSIDLAAPYAFALNTTTLGNGTHTIEARAYDISGRRATASRSVTISN